MTKAPQDQINADLMSALSASRSLVAQIAAQAKRIAELEAAMREFIAAAEKAKKAYTVPESVLVAMGYPKGEATS